MENFDFTQMSLGFASFTIGLKIVETAFKKIADMTETSWDNNFYRDWVSPISRGFEHFSHFINSLSRK